MLLQGEATEAKQIQKTPGKEQKNKMMKVIITLDHPGFEYKTLL